MIDRCASCGSDGVTTKKEDTILEYGMKPVKLEVTIPVHTCNCCGFTYTGLEAEVIQEQAIAKYLKTRKTK